MRLILQLVSSNQHLRPSFGIIGVLTFSTILSIISGSYRNDTPAEELASFSSVMANMPPSVSTIGTCSLNDFGMASTAPQTRLIWIKLEDETIYEYSVSDNQTTFTEFDNGTALLSGSAFRVDDASYRWDFSVQLINKRSWNDWSALGRTYGPGGGDHTSWFYYEVDPNASFFTGSGGHAGQNLAVSHRPLDYSKGFQVGYGANGKNAEYGISGWFGLSGAFTAEGDFNGNLDDCIAVAEDWNLSCEDGQQIEILGKGLKNNVPASLAITNSAEVDKIIVEVVYKGGNPGTSINLWTDDGTPYPAFREQPIGNSSNVYVYRAILPATSTIDYLDESVENRAQSILAYVFRQSNNVQQQSLGQFTYFSGYHTTREITFNLPTETQARNIDIKIPISELTEDCRILNITASAGGVLESLTISAPDDVLGCCLDIVELQLQNVPGDANSLVIQVESPTGSNTGCPVTADQNGQSFVVAGAVKVDVECVQCENVSDGGTIGENEESCEAFAASTITNLSQPTGGTGTLEYLWQRSTIAASGPWEDLFENSENYEPGVLNETTWFRRLAKRTGCDDYTGVSNVIVKVVDESCSCGLYCPGDLVLDCNASTHPDQTGYALILCGDGQTNDCERPAGENELSFEVFNSTNTSYTLDQGWGIGGGCNPNCGDGSLINAFIDFTQFNYPYDRSITSPVLNACCIDELYIDYCLRQDLFTNGTAPVQQLAVEVSIEGGNWTTFQSYETVNGATLDYLETGIVIPGAAGSSFNIRFRVSGPGGNFTMGGWGLDNVRIYGNSPGCETDAPDNYTVTYTDTETSGNCTTNREITRVWTATRTSGEQLSCTQKITIEDNLAPDIVSAPADVTISCDETFAPITPIFNDICNQNLSVSLLLDTLTLNCAQNKVITPYLDGYR